MNFTKNAQVLIIGGGIIGLSIARELHRKGARQITILERNRIGREASFAAAGMLAPNAETDQADDFFHFCNESNKLYPEFAEQLYDETGIDVELDRRGTLYLAFNDEDVREIRRRYEWQKKAHLTVEHLDAQSVHKLEPFVSPDVREALFFPNDWQVENRKLLYALEKYARLNDIEIIEDAEVTRLLIENGKICGAETHKQTFAAEAIVLTTGAWTSFIKAEDYASPSVKPLRGQIISYQTAKRLFQTVIYSPRGYLVPRVDGRILIGATVEDGGFDKRPTHIATEILRENALEIAPTLVNLNIVDEWVGLRPFAADGLPILGVFPSIENLFIATAHYRNGILLAPKTAAIMAERILDRTESKYFQAFGVRRFQTANAF